MKWLGLVASLNPEVDFACEIRSAAMQLRCTREIETISLEDHDGQRLPVKLSMRELRERRRFAVGVTGPR